MRFADWIARALALQEEHARLSDPSSQTVRRALIQLHKLILDAPAPAPASYETIDEQELQSCADDQIDRISECDYGWVSSEGINERDWMLAVAAQIRALDTFLITTARSHMGPPSDANDWYDAELDAFAIPRKRRKTSTRRDYFKRGLLSHRILPGEIRGHKVIVKPVASISRDTISRRITMGAALFANLRIDLSKTSGNFIVTGMVCDNPEGTVEQQLGSAISEQCFGVVWPELSVPPDLRDRIAGLLRKRALSLDPRPAPQVVVAGSWHEESSGGSVNVATVLNGYGARLLTYEKSLPFYSGRITEDIRPGVTIPILVTDDQVIAFGICRDFCDLSFDLPYPELDVDLVLVPSMGEETTMDGHLTTANRSEKRYGTRTFVVQQDTPQGSKSSNFGFVLPMLKNPSRQKRAKLRQSGIWKSYPKKSK
jgi:hypothetical protein